MSPSFLKNYILKLFLDKEFKIKDVGPLHFFLGMKILRESLGMIISQRKCTLDLEFDSLHLSLISSTMDPTIKLQANQGVTIQDHTLYEHLLGKLNYLTHTRIDLSFIVQHLSQFMQDSEPHLKVVLWVLRCLLTNPCLGLFMYASSSVELMTFCDYDWATNLDSRKSISDFYISLGSYPISWKSKKQTSISLSSAKAKYRSMRRAVAELIWLIRFFEDLDISIPLPVPLSFWQYCRHSYCQKSNFSWITDVVCWNWLSLYPSTIPHRLNFLIICKIIFPARWYFYQILDKTYPSATSR